VHRVVIWLMVVTLAGGCAYLAQTEQLPSPSPYDAAPGGPEREEPDDPGL
jgi:hypothetical protein